MTELARVQGLWSPSGHYLNTASYGLPPQPAWDALQRALEDWHHGRTTWEAWGDEGTEGARRLFAQLVGVPAERISTGGSAAQFVGLVAASVPDGARVVVPEGEFTSLLFPWLVHAGRLEVRTVPLERFLDTVADGCDVAAFSVVQSATGVVTDVEAVVEAAAASDALVIADGTQACGWLPVDASRVDGLVCAAYKWLMAPRGTAFLAVSDRLLERTTPLLANWYAGEDVHDAYYGTPLRLTGTARRLDTSPGWFAWVGTTPALQVLLDVGVAQVTAHDVALANRFRAGLGLEPADSAIVSTTVEGAEEKLVRAGIRAASRAGALRVSFHLYTTEADVDAALDALVP